MIVTRTTDVDILYKVIENYHKRQEGLEKRESEVRDRLKKLGELLEPGQSVTSSIRSKHSEFARESEIDALYSNDGKTSESFGHRGRPKKQFFAPRERDTRKSGFLRKHRGEVQDIESDSDSQITVSDTKTWEKHSSRSMCKKSASFFPEGERANERRRERTVSRNRVRRAVERIQRSEAERRVSWKGIPSRGRDESKGDRYRERTGPIVIKPSLGDRRRYFQEDGRSRHPETGFHFSRSQCMNGNDSNGSFTRTDSLSFFEKCGKVSNSSKNRRALHHNKKSPRRSAETVGRIVGQRVETTVSKQSLLKTCPDCNLKEPSHKCRNKHHHVCKETRLETPSCPTKKLDKNDILARYFDRACSSSEEFFKCKGFKSSSCSQDQIVVQLKTDSEINALNKSLQEQTEHSLSSTALKYKDFNEEYSDSFLGHLISKCLPKAELTSLSTDVKNPRNVYAKVQEICTLKKLVCEELEYREEIGKPFKLGREDKDLLIMNVMFANEVNQGLARGRSLKEIVSLFDRASKSGSVEERTLQAIRLANLILGESHPDPVGLKAIEQAASQCLDKLNSFKMAQSGNESLRSAKTSIDSPHANKTDAANHGTTNQETIKTLLEKKARDVHEETVRVNNKVQMLENDLERMKRIAARKIISSEKS